VTSVFLQVRLDSSRLPRKALADLGGKTVLERCLAALDGVKVDRRVVVTEPSSAPEIEVLVKAAGWDLFVGSKDNVLDRFVQAARQTGTKTIVRATGDNPLVSAALANLVLERHRVDEADFSALDGGPLGSGVEVARASAYEQALGSAPDAFECEHVSPFLYRRPDRFRVRRSPVPDSCRLPEARITLDTADDLSYLQALWADQFRGIPLEVEDLIPWLTNNPR
jgi:spore coat polysaccharide biosynthesis protein SpsF